MSTRREVKVGAFVLAGLTAISAVVFLIGDQRQLFQKKVNFEAVFYDVQGLQRGSPVRMGGVDIGNVAKVQYGEDAKDRQIHVVLSIVAEEARRVRRDSVASINAKGLLGDKMVAVSVGSPALPQIPPGGTIRSVEGEDMAAMMGRIGAISGEVEKMVNHLERTTSAFADERFHQDIKATVSSLRRITESVEKGEGYLGKLVGDRNESERVSKLVGNAGDLAASLEHTTTEVNAALARVNSGPGFAHDLVYGREGTEALDRFGRAANELEMMLRGVREGNGLAKGLLYGDGSSQQAISSLSSLSRELTALVTDIRAGKGTLGALLVDPSVYEDLKLLLGNVERNRALRALVRYSIKKDEQPPSVEVKDPTKARKIVEPGR